MRSERRSQPRYLRNLTQEAFYLVSTEEEEDEVEEETDVLEERIGLMPKVVWDTWFDNVQAEAAEVAEVAGNEAVETCMKEIVAPMCNLIAAEAAAAASKAVLKHLKRKYREAEVEDAALELLVREGEEEVWEV